MNVARTISSRPVPGGYAVFHGNKQVLTFPDLDDANDAAREAHELNLAFHEMGQSLGTVVTPEPQLFLWTDGGADGTA